MILEAIKSVKVGEDKSLRQTDTVIVFKLSDKIQDDRLFDWYRPGSILNINTRRNRVTVGYTLPDSLYQQVSTNCVRGVDVMEMHKYSGVRVLHRNLEELLNEKRDITRRIFVCTYPLVPNEFGEFINFMEERKLRSPDRFARGDFEPNYAAITRLWFGTIDKV